MDGDLEISLENKKQSSSKWFKELRNQMVGSIEKIDNSNFKEKQWDRLVELEKYSDLINALSKTYLDATLRRIELAKKNLNNNL